MAATVYLFDRRMLCSLWLATELYVYMYNTDQLNNIEESIKYYRQILHYDSSNIEAIASLGANYFYTDQPELALRLYDLRIAFGKHQIECHTLSFAKPAGCSEYS
eukprot:COSAG05_NODE_2306_length_3249_cov_2.568889_4_plen_105_part_00